MSAEDEFHSGDRQVIQEKGDVAQQQEQEYGPCFHGLRHQDQHDQGLQRKDDCVEQHKLHAESGDFGELLQFGPEGGIPAKKADEHEVLLRICDQHEAQQAHCNPEEQMVFDTPGPAGRKQAQPCQHGGEIHADAQSRAQNHENGAQGSS